MLRPSDGQRMSESATRRRSLPSRFGWLNIAYLAFLLGCLLVILETARDGQVTLLGGMSLWVMGAVTYGVLCLGATVIAWGRGRPVVRPAIGLGLAILSMAMFWPVARLMGQVLSALR